MGVAAVFLRVVTNSRREQSISSGRVELPECYDQRLLESFLFDAPASALGRAAAAASLPQLLVVVCAGCKYEASFVALRPLGLFMGARRSEGLTMPQTTVCDFMFVAIWGARAAGVGVGERTEKRATTTPASGHSTGVGGGQ